MTEIFTSSNLKKDYTNFKKEFETVNNLKYGITAKVEPSFKKNHKLIYCIALISCKLRKEYKNDNNTIYFEEILSDSLTLTTLAFIGFEQPAYIVFRRMVENLYNHVFYFNHPVEYTHLNLGKNEYVPIRSLKEYLQTHPNFLKSEDVVIKEFNDELFNQYHQLCNIAHSKGKAAMSLAKCLKDLKQSYDIQKFINRVNKALVYIIYLAYKFHKELKYSTIERALITASIPSNKRSKLHS